MNKKVWISASIFFLCSVAAGAQAQAERQTFYTEQPFYVVSNYLSAWETGDDDTMYSLLDKRSRQSVTPDQLKHFFTITVPTGGRNEVPYQELPKGFDQALRGRITSVIGIVAHVETDEYATVDCTVETTLRSLNDATYPPDLLRLVAPVAAMDKPVYLNTLDGSFKTITHGQDYQDKQGPYVTLYLHRYVLVKENGQWRISNAITVADRSPDMVAP